VAGIEPVRVPVEQHMHTWPVEQFAGLADVVAAILPSRRAAKLNILRAIVTE